MKSKIIKTHPSYRIFEDGRIQKIKCGTFIKTHKTNGYVGVSLNGEMKLLHRLLCISFKRNPNNYPIVNHKNGIKNDNRLENLEWCTQSHNVLHAIKIGLNPGMTPEILAKIKMTSIRKLCYNTISGVFYDSVKECGQSHGVTMEHMSGMLRGSIKQKFSVDYA